MESMWASGNPHQPFVTKQQAAASRWFPVRQWYRPSRAHSCCSLQLQRGSSTQKPLNIRHDGIIHFITITKTYLFFLFGVWITAHESYSLIYSIMPTKQTLRQNMPAANKDRNAPAQLNSTVTFINILVNVFFVV